MSMSPASPVLSAEATALVTQTLGELGAHFDMARTDLMVAGREVRIHHPRNADDLIDEQAFVDDERLPYWADLWPSARVLAERVATMPVDGRRFLELGCGTGLVSVAAAIAGFDVTATDYYDEALRYADIALKIAQEIGHMYTVADVYQTIASSHIGLGDVREGASRAEQAGELFVELGARPQAAEALRTAAEAWRLLGDEERARAAEARARSLLN